METLKQLIDKLEQEQTLSSEELIRLLREYEDQDLQNYLFEKSRAIRHHYYGNDVYIRGLIEFYQLLQKRLLLLRNPKE